MSLGPVFDAALAAQAACAEAGLPHRIIGGVALQRWGEPRFTADAGLSVLVEPGSEDAATRPFWNSCRRELTMPPGSPGGHESCC